MPFVLEVTTPTLEGMMRQRAIAIANKRCRNLGNGLDLDAEFPTVVAHGTATGITAMPA